MAVKRAVLFGAILWVVIFFEVSILMFGFNLTAGTTYYIIHYVLLILLAGIVSALYFNSKTTKKGFAEGLKAGILFAITGIILDAIITIPLFIKDYSFFLNIYLWIGIIEGIFIAGIVGEIKR